jgi:hypothetical protein
MFETRENIMFCNDSNLRRIDEVNEAIDRAATLIIHWTLTSTSSELTIMPKSSLK